MSQPAAADMSAADALKGLGFDPGNLTSGDVPGVTYEPLANAEGQTPASGQTSAPASTGNDNWNLPELPGTQPKTESATPPTAANTAAADLAALDLSKALSGEQETPAVESTTAQPQTPAPQQQPTEQQRRSRDLSAFPEHLHPTLRQMSNSAWDLVKDSLTKAQQAAKLETELAELRKAEKPWMYGHPEAHKLTDEYRAYQDDLNKVEQADGYWQEQFLRFKAGQPVNDLVIDEDDKLRVGHVLPNTPETELLIQKRIAACQGARTRVTSELAQWQQKFTNDTTAVRQRVTELNTKLFSNPPEAVKQGAQQVLGWLPPVLRSQPEYQAIAHLYAYVQLANKEIERLKSTQSARSVVNSAAAQVPSTNGTPVSSNPAGVVNGDTTVKDTMSFVRQMMEMN